MDFVYIDSAESLAEFDQFMRSLRIKEVQGAVLLIFGGWMFIVLFRLVGPLSDERMDLAVLNQVAIPHERRGLGQHPLDD